MISMWILFLSFFSYVTVYIILFLHIFIRVRPQIPVLKEVQPLLEIDRDERKLDVFLTFHRSSLLISDMKIFLPFTINLDPYIKKKIKEEQQSIEEDTNLFHKQSVWHSHGVPVDQWPPQRGMSTNRHMKLAKQSSLQGSVPPTPSWAYQPNFEWQAPPVWMQMEPMSKPLSATTMLPVHHKLIVQLSLVVEKM